MTAGLVIADHPLSDPISRQLIAELDTHLTSFPGNNFLVLDEADVAPDSGAFLVARLDGEPVGCGAIRLFDGGRSAEVKRMWVRPEVRGASIGTAVLAELERRAIALGATRLALETADHLVAAIAIYERAGFTRCPCWGEYACSDSSICFEKLLA